MCLLVHAHAQECMTLCVPLWNTSFPVYVLLCVIKLVIQIFIHLLLLSVFISNVILHQFITHKEYNVRVFIHHIRGFIFLVKEIKRAF